MRILPAKEMNVTVRIALINNFGFSYRCDCNGTILKEANEMIAEDATDSFDISIPSTEVITDINGEAVVWYIIETVRASDGKMSKKSRRFKEFHDLQEDISSAFVGNHLVHSLPKLPSRGIKYFSDHLDPLFVEKRRHQLQAYMRGLTKVPRVLQNPSLLNFIGFGKNDAPLSPSNNPVRANGGLRDDSLKMSDFNEFSFSFESGPLGIILKNTTSKYGSSIVDGFNANPDGSIGAAEKGGVISSGDIVSRINGVSVTGSSYDEVIALIKSAPRPVTIHFLRKRGSNPPKPRASVTSEAAPPVPVGKKVSLAPAYEEEGLFS
jgi:hypothetical protein